MTTLTRQQIAAAKVIVIKVGTRVLTTDQGMLDRQRIENLAEELHDLMRAGRQVVLVSSGAVGAGMHRLGLPNRPTDLAHLQAVAAVGQSALIEAYDQTLRRHGRHAAQVLLTADGLDDRTRYLNVRNTILSLLEYGAIPIINENDTVAVDELMTTFGDNDRLAALVANLIRAPLLIILSDVDGLYDGDPQAAEAQLVPTVEQLDQSVYCYVQDRATGITKGGMASKLDAARMVTQAGENVVIANGHTPGVLARIVAGDEVGTWIIAQSKSITPWKRWIGHAVQPRGRLILDAGARVAIERNGRSLLAIGIVDTQGDFRKGDVVSLCNQGQAEFARGLTNYSVSEIKRIKGLKSDQIASVLGQLPYDEVIHRDNMTVLTTSTKPDAE